MAAENHYRGKIACRNSTSFSDCHFQAFPVLATAFPPCSSSLNNNNNNMYIYHALFNAPSAHRIRIDLNTIFYTHVEHRPTKTIYIRYYMETRARARTHTHARTHARTYARTHAQKEMFVMLLNWFISLNFELFWESRDDIYISRNCTLNRVLLRCECFQVMMTCWFERLFLVFTFVFAVVFCPNETCTFEFALNIQVVNYASFGHSP